MDRKPSPQSSGRRHRLLEWLFGSPPVAGPETQADAPVVAPSLDDLPEDDEDRGRSALLGSSAARSNAGKPLRRASQSAPTEHTTARAARAPGGGQQPSPARPAPAASRQTPGARLAPNGGEQSLEQAPAPAPARPPIPREMFRVNANLPANLDVGAAKDLAVRITNLSGTGAALLSSSPRPLPEGNHWLDLALPNRQKPLEIEVIVVHSRAHTGAQGQEQQVIHVKFPSIRRNEQDAIIAYINNIRLYEDKQFTVAAKVMLEVVTGRRRFAKFTGETIEIRPDLMRLMMDDFDAIVGAEVMLTIMAPHFADHLDVDNVTIEKVDVVGPRKAEVEVALAKPDDKVLLFIRKHYPGVAKGRR